MGLEWPRMECANRSCLAMTDISYICHKPETRVLLLFRVSVLEPASREGFAWSRCLSLLAPPV